MGRGFAQYSYIDVDRPDEVPLYSGYLVYILDDGTRLHVNQGVYFCPTCNHFVIGEVIESVPKLEQWLDRVRNDSQSRERKIAEFIGNIPKQIAEMNIRINWRGKRQSPPKCLHCGCIEIQRIPDEEEFPHPATGLRMKVSGRGFASTDEWHATYTAEGDQIEAREA